MHDYLLTIQGIGTWWIIIGPKSLGIGFEYIGDWFWFEYGNEMFVNAWEWSEWNLLLTVVNTLC